QDVVPEPAVEEVVPAETADDVVPGRADEDVAARSAGDRAARSARGGRRSREREENGDRGGEAKHAPSSTVRLRRGSPRWQDLPRCPRREPSSGPTAGSCRTPPGATRPGGRSCCCTEPRARASAAAPTRISTRGC